MYMTDTSSMGDYLHMLWYNNVHKETKAEPSPASSCQQSLLLSQPSASLEEEMQKDIS